MSTRRAGSSFRPIHAKASWRALRMRWSSWRAVPSSAGRWAKRAVARSSVFTPGTPRSTGSWMSIARRYGRQRPPDLQQRSPPLLVRQQFPFPIEPPGIAAERSIAADDTVARDQHCNMVVAVRSPDCPHGLRLPDRGGALGIAAGFADRDLAQLAPDRFLERGSGDVDRKLVCSARALNCLQRSFDQFPQSAGVFDDRSVGEKPAQRIRAVVEGQPANAVARRGDQHPPQWAVEMSPADGLATPAVAPGRWGHSQSLLRIAVEAARPRIAGVVDRICHSAVSLQCGLRPSIT